MASVAGLSCSVTCKEPLCLPRDFTTEELSVGGLDHLRRAADGLAQVDDVHACPKQSCGGCMPELT